KPEFKDYANQIVKNARALADGLTRRGIDLVSGGTDNHLMLVDLRNLNLTGKELEQRLDSVYITANKNAVPNDPQKPFVTSGVRLGTAAVTARGMKEDDMEKIAEFIALAAKDYEQSVDKIRAGVEELCKKYPLYE
ncbi:MAG: serine hydroxymethyltransferase, partial [Clostridiales bacterium]|nr:serine hydroxymethyltransferase [Clostridiales bacterium]